MSMQAENPRAVLGGNEPPDFAKLETARLIDEYRGFTNTLEDLATEAKAAIPAGVADDPTALRVGGVIKRFRDLSARLEQTRVVEVEPNLRRMNAENAFFNGLKKLIQPEDKQERRVSPGWIDKLQTLIDGYQARKEAAERERLERERIERENAARQAREAAERAAEETRKKEREAAEAQASADRARNEEIKAEKQRIADEAAKVAADTAARAKSAEQNAATATEAATDARIGTLVAPQDIVRTRGVTEEGAGVTLTTGKESFAYVIDRTHLDPKKLFPYFHEKEVEKALRAWAKATNHNEPMDGAEIGWKRKGVTR